MTPLQPVDQILPKTRSLPALKSAAANCRGCPLYARATQTVFGAGSSQASLLILGEQPGDTEDRLGKPFVGPAGRLLDELLGEAGISRHEVYVTNSVKHFKWTPRGKRRLHARPSSRDLLACRPWFEAELAAVCPRLVVCLGATAAQQFPGQGFRVTRSGDRFTRVDGQTVLPTLHPSAILRAESDRRAILRSTLLKHLTSAVEWLRR